MNQEIYQVGEIKTSLLEPEEFKARHGEAWVLMDGRDVTGSEFAALTGMTNVPDVRGKFLRMSNNGAKGEMYDPEFNRSLGSYQRDAFQNHVHEYEITNNGGNGALLPNPRQHYSKRKVATNPVNTGTFKTDDKETRPKNVLVNYYIKIRSCSEADNVCM